MPLYLTGVTGVNGVLEHTILAGEIRLWRSHRHSTTVLKQLWLLAQWVPSDFLVMMSNPVKMGV